MTDPVQSLGLTDLFHVGIVVNDLDDAMQRYKQLGIGPWATFDAEMAGVFRGRDTSIGARIAFAKSGPTYLELVQPTKGEFTASAFLAERGEGAYHLGYWVEDLAASMERAVALGFAIDIVSEQGGFAYLDATNSAGLHMELVSTRNRQAIDRFLEGTEPPS